MKEDEEGWVYVPPVEDVFTVFPGKRPFVFQVVRLPKRNPNKN